MYKKICGHIQNICWIKKFNRARLRKIMRGYRLLKHNNRLHLINKIQRSFTEHKLNIDIFNPIIIGSVDNPEIVLRQYLLLRIGYTNFCSALMYAEATRSKSINFPMPKQWRVIVEKEGFCVNNFNSGLLWAGLIFLLYCYGIFKIGEILIGGLFSKNKLNIEDINFSYFFDLNSGNLPKTNQENDSNNIISWYLKWPGRDHSIRSIRHGVNNVGKVIVDDIIIERQSKQLPNLSSLRSISLFILWSIYAVLISFYDLLKGRWWNAVLLNQAAYSALVRFIPSKKLAKEYMFQNSSWIYRPLWTYEASKKGSKIHLYFYSTNCESFQTEENYPPIYFGYKSMSWPSYIVWDNYQEEFIKRAVGNNANISVVGRIDFIGGGEAPQLKGVAIAVFDVTPYRESRYCVLAPQDDFHTPGFINTYLTDVSEVLANCSYIMAWKAKRDIGRRAHPLYRKKVEIISQNINVVCIDTNVSATYLIERCVGVISSPYTSTSVIAKEMGKPCIYYDPSKMLRRGDRAAHGIQVIQCRLELEAWLKSLT
jgi:polysaccharide biosynthesis PFTS motif protein